MGADEAGGAGDEDDMATGAGAGSGRTEDAVLPIGAAPGEEAGGIRRRGRGVEEEEVEEREEEECPEEELSQGEMVAESVNVDGFVH